MRSLLRNKVKFTYKNYLGKEYLVDDEGFNTGETVLTFSNPIEVWANISPATGITNTEIFGNLTDYDKVIVTTDIWLDIDENSILWLDTDYGPDTPHDYIVKRVSKGLNGIAIAVSKVKVSYGARN